MVLIFTSPLSVIADGLAALVNITFAPLAVIVFVTGGVPEIALMLLGPK